MLKPGPRALKTFQRVARQVPGISYCWHHEQIHRNNPVSVIAEKRPPALRRWSPPARHILGHTRLPGVDAELEEFAMHPRCAPERVGKAHLTDQAAYFQRHRRPAPANSRFPSPIGSRPRSVPTDHGVWLDDRQCVASGRQPPKQADEYQPIDAAEARPLWRRPPQYVDL